MSSNHCLPVLNDSRHVIPYTTMTPSAPRRKLVVMVRNRSAPPVSQIWSLIVLPSSSIVRIFCSAAAQGVPRQRQACLPYRALGLSKKMAVRRTKSAPIVAMALTPGQESSCAARTRARQPQRIAERLAQPPFTQAKAHREARAQPSLARPRLRTDQHDFEQVVKVLMADLMADLRASITAMREEELAHRRWW